MLRQKKLILIGLILLGGCATSTSIKISSSPEGANVSARGSDGATRLIGKTPLKIENSELSQSEGRITSLAVTKDGYQEQQILLGRDRGKENYDINIRLQGQIEDPKVLDAKGRQEKLAKSMVQAHNLITGKRYDEARSLLTAVVQDYPHISVGYDLLGTLSYLQKDLKSALNYYERSLQINPENFETKQMVDRLKGMLQ